MTQDLFRFQKLDIHGYFILSRTLLQPSVHDILTTTLYYNQDDMHKTSTMRNPYIYLVVFQTHFIRLLPINMVYIGETHELVTMPYYM